MAIEPSPPARSAADALPLQAVRVPPPALVAQSLASHTGCSRTLLQSSKPQPAQSAEMCWDVWCVTFKKNTLFLQTWGFYEFLFFGTDRISLCLSSLMNGPLRFKKGLSGPLRLGALGVGTF